MRRQINMLRTGLYEQGKRISIATEELRRQNLPRGCEASDAAGDEGRDA